MRIDQSSPDIVDMLIDDAFSVLQHDADETQAPEKYEREALRRKFSTRLNTRASQPATPTGGEEWKLVPVEPTQEMVGAAEEAREAYSSYTFADSYREMVQAAPARCSAGSGGLLTCPLCRSKASFIEKDFPPIGFRYGVECRECDCRCDYRKATKEEAAAQWNWRPNDAAQSGTDQQFLDDMTLAHNARNAALKMLAGLFSESVHETWTKEEIANIIQDAIRLGSPHSSTERHGLLGCRRCGGHGGVLLGNRDRETCDLCGGTGADPDQSEAPSITSPDRNKGA